jgi:hypothetical protein
MSLAYNELTAQQQKTIANCDALARQALLDARVAIASMRKTLLDLNATSGSALQQLDLVETIPTNSNLAGSSSVTVQAFQDLLSTYAALLDMWDTPQVRLLHTTFVGAVNIDGR